MNPFRSTKVRHVSARPQVKDDNEAAFLLSPNVVLGDHEPLIRYAADSYPVSFRTLAEVCWFVLLYS